MSINPDSGAGNEINNGLLEGLEIRQQFVDSPIFDTTKNDTTYPFLFRDHNLQHRSPDSYENPLMSGYLISFQRKANGTILEDIIDVSGLIKRAMPLLGKR